MAEKQTDVLTTNRMYKSRIFAMLFSDRNELLKLYNAINGTSYDDPDLLQVNTLENAIYMSMQNDVSFMIIKIKYLELCEYCEYGRINTKIEELSQLRRGKERG